MTFNPDDLADPAEVLDSRTLTAWASRNAEADIAGMVADAAVGGDGWWDDALPEIVAAIQELVPGDDPLADDVTQQAMRLGYRSARTILGPLPPCRTPTSPELVDVLGGLDSMSLAFVVPDLASVLGEHVETLVAAAVDDQHQVPAYLEVALIAVDFGVALAVVEQDRCIRNP